MSRLDLTALEELRREIDQMAIISLGRLAERGRKHLADEVPYRTGNLRQGVAPPDIDTKKMIATLTVSARSARRGPRSATLHLKSGKTKQIKLRARKEYNYAAAIARGRRAVNPKRGWAILIPVDSAPNDESYITEGGNIYIVRKSAKAVKPNPFDERAAKKLRAEAVSIVEAVASEVLNG